MRKTFLLVFIFSLLYSYENKFSYDINSGNKTINLMHSPEYVEVEGGYTRLSKMGEGHSTELGMPELPQFSTYFQLDPYKTYEFEFEVKDSYVVENIIIMPHQGMDKWEVEHVNILDEETYDSYAVYPEQNLVISDRIQGRGIEYVSLYVIPYKYHPKNQKLEVFSSIDIHVIETGVNYDNELNQPKRSHIFDKYYKDLMVNFEYSDRPDDYQASAILYICGGSSLDNSYVQDLIEWRHKQGYIVYAASETEVGGSSASTSEIKNYISDAYFNWENPPEIVGLIGDTGGSYSLPNYSHSWSGYSGATDFDYTQLDGGDMIPEVFIGRISGSSSDVENIINKTIHYEKADHVPDSWFQKAGLVGDPDESGNSTIFTNQYIDNLMTNHGMTDIRTDYDGSGTQTFMEQQFNEGILYYNYRGWYYGYGSYPTNSINNDWDTPFVTTITCGTGDFDYTASSEEFVWLGSVNNPKGAVGAVGMATTGTHTMYNNIVDMGIYEGIFTKKLWHAGVSVANGAAAIVSTYPSPNSAANAAEAFSKWSNLIGDPALHLWSAVPTNFNIDHPSSISLGNTMLDLTIMDENNMSVKDARVTLLMGADVIFETGFTDENGQVTLNWDAVETGDMSITVTKRNHRPYEGMIEIASSAVAVSMDFELINVISGENTDFDITLHNHGILPAFNVMAELSSPSEYVMIDEGILFYGNILPDASVTRSFPVYVTGTAFDMEDLEFKLHIIDDSGNSWINLVPVNVIGPYLLIDESMSVAYPGESANMAITLHNMGSSAFNDFTFELSSFDDLIIINSEVSHIDNLLVNDHLLLDEINMSFNSSIINGSIFPLNLAFTSSDGFTRHEIINVMVGEVRENDPVGPDAHGYYIYGNEDEEYELAPVYEWIEIADGLGDQLNISDSGNGNCSGNSFDCSSMVIYLPFTFTFYGVDYEQIVVNTNGWISFGDFEMYSFRNYPIPGAGGPSPMVAAFWDDLKTGSSGYVHYYDTNEMVIIQWDNMRTYDGGDRETFEIILYNKELADSTPTGDSEIKIQYQEFHNTSNGSYSGYTPYHGCYSTVGIESRLGDMGLEYTFNNEWSDAAGRLGNESAIFITTSIESSYVLGDVNGDGVLDVLDVVILVNSVLGDDFPEAGDMNQDGVLDVLDIVLLVNAILA